MSQYSFQDQPPKKGGNGLFYVVLVLVALLLVSLFVRFLWPALRQPGAVPEIVDSPSEITTTQAAVSGETVTTAATQTTAAVPTEPVTTPQTTTPSSWIINETDIEENASIPDMLETIGQSVVGISNRTMVSGRGRYYGTINGIPVASDSEEATEQEQGYGSGIIISADGYIITNAHVVEDASNIVVILAGEEEVPAELIGADETTDLALLKIEREGLTTMPIGDSDAARVGETALAIGNPMGQEYFGSVTKGIISATNRKIISDNRIFTMIQSDAAMNPGNSGGALVNIKGELLGIVSMGLRTSNNYDAYGNALSVEGLGFAIPINHAMEIVNELKEKGYIARPYLGISGSFLSEDGAAYYRCPVGYLVKETVRGAAADKAGIRSMDIITAIDGVKMDNYTQLSTTISEHQVGDTVTVSLWRDGETLEVSLTFDATPKPE